MDVSYTEPMLAVEGSLRVPGAMKNWTPVRDSTVRLWWDHRSTARCSREVESGPGASSSPGGGLPQAVEAKECAGWVNQYGGHGVRA